MKRQFTAIIEREGDGYVGLCPELDVASQGTTVAEARANLQEAIELFLETASPTEIERRLSGEVYIARSSPSTASSRFVGAAVTSSCNANTARTRPRSPFRIMRKSGGERFRPSSARVACGAACLRLERSIDGPTIGRLGVTA
jgi:predicted RNase H-like HicB family nuclease